MELPASMATAVKPVGDVMHGEQTSEEVTMQQKKSRRRGTSACGRLK